MATRTKDQLVSELNTFIPDNPGDGSIRASNHKPLLRNILDSLAFSSDIDDRIATKAIPGLLQVSPSAIVTNNLPQRFVVRLHVQRNEFPTATQAAIVFAGETTTTAFNATLNTHIFEVHVTNPRRAVLAAYALATVQTLTVRLMDAADVELVAFNHSFEVTALPDPPVQRTGAEIVSLIDTALGSMDWQTSAQAGIVSVSVNTVIPENADGQTYRLTGSTARRFSLPEIGTGTGDVSEGWQIVLVNDSSAELTVAADGAETIEGTPQIAVAAGRAVRLQAVAANEWGIIADTARGSSASGDFVTQSQLTQTRTALEALIENLGSEPFELYGDYQEVAFNATEFAANTIAESRIMVQRDADGSSVVLIGLAPSDQFALNAYFSQGLRTRQNVVIQTDGENPVAVIDQNLRAIANAGSNKWRLTLTGGTQAAARPGEAMDVLIGTTDAVIRGGLIAIRDHLATTAATIESLLAETRDRFWAVDSRWESHSAARNLKFVVRPRVAIAANERLSFDVAGFAVHVDVHPGIPVDAAVTNSVVTVPITKAQSQTIMTNHAVGNTFDVELTIGAVTYTTWMRVVQYASGKWRELAGSSPYTIETTDDEFLILFSEDSTVQGTDDHYTLFLPKLCLAQASRRFLTDSERPDGDHAAELGVDANLNATGTQLTLTLHQAGGSSNRFEINGVFAR